MALEQKTGSTKHFFEALPKLVPPYWGKPRIASMLLAYISRVQDLEDSIFDVMTRYTIDGADTERLNVLGRIVGAIRSWSDDEVYRHVIRGKIRANRSRGLTDDIVDVVQIVLPTTSPVYVESYAPATVYVWTDAVVDTTDVTALTYLLPKARAAGVQLQFFWSDAALVDRMVWDTSLWDDGSLAWNVEIL